MIVKYLTIIHIPLCMRNSESNKDIVLHIGGQPLHTMRLLFNIGFVMRRKSLVNVNKYYKETFLHFNTCRTFLYLLYLNFYDYSVKFCLFSLIKHIFHRNSLKRMRTKYEKHKK